MFEPLTREEQVQAPPSLDGWKLVSPIPNDAPEAPAEHPNLGKSSVKYAYRDQDGRILFLVNRFDKQDGDKEFLPLTYCHDAKGNHKWRWKGYPAPRPLYGLGKLSKHPDAIVLVVEGEKTAFAAQKLFPDHVVTTSSGGANAAKKTDWSPLDGRRVVIWPDNDKPGKKYASQVVELANKIGAVSVSIVKVPAGFPDKWDLADKMPEGWHADRLQELINNATADQGEHWPEPQPLHEEVAPRPFPVDALPRELQDVVKEVQTFTQAPMAMVVSSALAALSTAGQAYVDVRRAEKLEGPSSLFLLTIAESGERKSTVDGYFIEPIRDYEQKQAEIADPEIVKHKAKMQEWDAKLSGLKDRIRQFSKKGSPTNTAGQELAKLEAEEPTPPRVPRLLYSDTTSEQLAFSLAKKWPSGAVASSEAGLVFGGHSMNAESLMRTLSFYNVMWDGGTFHSDRRTSESFTIKGARLTVGLQIQKAVLNEFLKRGGDVTRGIGFFARCLIAWPESTQGYRPFREPPEDWPAVSAFKWRMTKIMEIPAPLDSEGNLTPHMLELSPEAKSDWITLHNAVEVELRDTGELADVRDVASKIADNAVRIAALFHLYETGPYGLITQFEGASRVAAWFLHEARRFFSGLGVSKEEANMARLDKWLIDHCLSSGEQSVSTGDILQRGPSKLRNKPTRDTAIAGLVELDHIRLVEQGRKKLVEINPALLSERGSHA